MKPLNDLNCPYCNAELSIQTIDFPSFVAPCCNRFVTAHSLESLTISLGVPSQKFMTENGLEGDITAISSMPKLDDMRPASPWTMVCSGYGTWFVRLMPKDADLEDLGRPWGLALATEFTSAFEAHKFADSVDLFMNAAFDAKKQEDELRGGAQ